MKLSKLGKNTVKARPAQNKPQKANKAKQKGSPFKTKGSAPKRMIQKKTLDYGAKAMNPAISNKLGKAVNYMISEGTKNLGLKRNRNIKGK